METQKERVMQVPKKKHTPPVRDYPWKSDITQRKNNNQKKTLKKGPIYLTVLAVLSLPKELLLSGRW